MKYMEDMDYENFKKTLAYGMEFIVEYKNQRFNVSQRTDLGELYFTITPDNYYTFKHYEELLAAPLIDGKTFEEKWDELEVY